MDYLSFDNLVKAYRHAAQGQRAAALPPFMPGLCFALVYAGAGWYRAGTGRISPLLGDYVLADFLVSFFSVFLVIGMTAVAGSLDRSARHPAVQRALGAFCGLVFIGLPAAMMLAILDWLAVLLSVCAIAGKIPWRKGRQETDWRPAAYLFGRAFLSVFVCFVPALIVCAKVYGRGSFSFEETDFIPLFGVVYFSGQALLDFLPWKLLTAAPQAAGKA